MKLKLLIVLMGISVMGCSKKQYTNEECIAEISKKVDLSSLDRQDRAFAEVGISVACSENNNDPTKTLEALNKEK